jgi:hypothetical protein
MDAIFSVLGVAMLVLIGVAMILGLVVLVLYELRWIIRLGRRRWRRRANSRSSANGIHGT